jgi:CheY-like chemotaxis protein
LGVYSNGLLGRKILVVEDAYLVAMDLCEEMEGLGCTVVGPVGRLELALDLAQREQIDGAVLDVNLAGELSFPVAEALSARHIPYVLVTSYDDDAAFPSEYRNILRFSKPYRSSHLAPILARYFGGPS